jgi:hypothetical protein
MDLIELTEAFLAAKQHALLPTRAAPTALIWWPLRGCFRGSL